MIILCTAIRFSEKSSTSRSGLCSRTACASRRPSPTTRTLARCEACITATLEITAAVAVAPANSCDCASTGAVPHARLARIRQPFRRAGQFVFIAVLLHSCKVSCLLPARQACRTRPCLLHGRSRLPSKSFPPSRHTTDRPRARSRYAVAGWRRRRSFRSRTSRYRPDAACRLADPLCPGEDFSPAHPAPACARSAIRRDLGGLFFARSRRVSFREPFELPARASLRVFSRLVLQPSVPLAL